MLLTPEIIVNLLLKSLIFVFLIIGFIIALRIVLFFNVKEDTPLQYSLLKEEYLASVIIAFGLFFKILLFFYFIYTIDKLSNIIPGAMCAAGVITANSYGAVLMLLKILNIYLFAFWLFFNHKDSLIPNYCYTKLKFKFFIVVFLFFLAEYILEWRYFLALDVNKIVSCCGVIFSAISQSLVLSIFLKIPSNILVFSFYLLFFMAVFSKNSTVLRVVGVLFIPVSILAVIKFFSPYIYELPTHHCPFCILQKEYGYVGYFIYLSIFVSTFGLITGYKRVGRLFLTVVVLILSYFVIAYYLKNGVWL